MKCEKWKRLSSDWEEQHSFAIFGFGDVAHTYLDSLMKFIKIEFIIDNRLQSGNESYHGIPVYKFQDIPPLYDHVKIIVAAETLMFSSISSFLEEKGLSKYVDYVDIERFICEWFYTKSNSIFLMEVHSAITTYCTFNCIHCNMFIPLYKTKQHVSLEELKHNIDSLFMSVDFLFKYQLLGGEPFLNPALADYLVYLKDRYDDRIGRIRIVTNGDVIPNDSLVSAMRYSNAEVLLSDYSAQIQYEKRFTTVKKILSENEIPFVEIKSKKWRDIGFPRSIINRKEESVPLHTEQCCTAWHGLANDKLYFCNTAWSAENAGLYKLKNDDYISLSEKDSNNGERLLAMCMGMFPKGYHSFCQVCDGMGEDNQHFVDVGEQVK